MNDQPPSGFIVTQFGDLEYKGEVIRVHGEYMFLTDDQKREVLVQVIEWAMKEFDKLP